MDKKTTGIVAYITFIGWLVAYFAGDKEGAKFQLNQTLVLWIGFIIAGVLGYLPFVGGILSLVCWIALLVLWIIGLIGAVQGEDKPMPVISTITLLK